MRPLHLACLLGYLPVAIALHELGADVRQHGQSGVLAVLWMAAISSPGCI